MPAANIVPLALTDGIVYCTNTPITPTEAALGDNTQVPNGLISVIEGQVLVAIVKLNVNGQLTSGNTFVFMQTDMGDGTWIDVAWCNTQMRNGSQTFVLCGGNMGAANNAFGPLRQQNSAPATQANGSNSIPLGGRVRFTGQSFLAGGSSSLAGTIPLVQATIIFKMQHPR